MKMMRQFGNRGVQSRVREQAGGICRLDALMPLFGTTRSLMVAAL